MFKKILIANRGEIACRIIKTARKLGIKTVAICSEPDLSSPHVNLADEYFNIGGNTSAESYLIIEKIIDVLKKSNADAVCIISNKMPVKIIATGEKIDKLLANHYYLRLLK